MGGCQPVSSSQQKSASQTSAESLSAHADGARLQNLPSSFATPALDQRCSPDLLNDGECDESCSNEQELDRNQSRADRPAGDGPLDTSSDVNTNGCSSPPVEQQAETPHISKLSLFTGMELVTKGASPCIRETEGTEDNSTEDTAVHKMKSISGSTINTAGGNSVGSSSSQPVSAFSFVNF